MTAAAVSYALGKLDVIINIGMEMYNVSDEIRMMRLELRMIEGFLKDADSKSKRSPAVKQWVNEVRDTAYRIEDVVDTFLVDVEGTHRRSSSICRKLIMFLKKPLKVKKLVDEIKAIRNTLNTISKLKTDLGITDSVSGPSGSEENSRTRFRLAKLPDDVEAVGLESENRQIINQLLDTSILRRTVLSIVGIGGLGKTTLARKVFKSAQLVGRFHCRLWLSISQKFNVNTVLREILYLVQPNMRDREPAVADSELKTELDRSFTSRKRYFIVLDDVWTTDLWESLKTALPDRNNASRVLITSRFLNVASAADATVQPYKLRYLNDAESLALLFKKAFQNRELRISNSRSSNILLKYVKHFFGWLGHLSYQLPDEETLNQFYSIEQYPKDLIEVAKQLTNKCGGLPLALVVLGGILSTRDPTYSAWQRVKETMDWHNQEAEQCSQILVTSYEDLPYHLKPCFLYFASFPEDYQISAKHVTRMWIAEGLVPKDGAGRMEDRAEEFLEELVQRCLVQVIEKSWSGYCKLCGIHDLLREIAMHEAKEENFFAVFSEANGSSQVVAEMVRRATLHQITPPKFEILAANTRSLICFQQYIPNYSGFRLLRVLTIEHTNMRQKKIAYERWLDGLVHLRYLGLRYCTMPGGFERISFSSLKNIETIDCKGTGMLSLNLQNNYNGPSSLWEIPTLRHVVVDLMLNLHCPTKWDTLKNLQTLKWVRLENLPKLEYNINLRTLGIHNREQYGSVEDGWRTLQDLLEKTENLISLAVRVIGGCVPFLTAGTSSLLCHERIQCLYLSGEWARDACVLNMQMLPTNLTKFTLQSSNLEQDPMPILERLPSLKILRLWGSSYVGNKLICSANGFLRLQKLELKDLANLHYWDIEKGAMPILDLLIIDGCLGIRRFPELQNVPSLQDLTLDKVLHENIQADQATYKIKHISSLRIKH